jgi:UDP-GlcNAc3NAcA epimerase
MHVMSIVGARPQFVKAAALSSELRHHHHEILVHTGQHYDSSMSDVFFRELELPSPDVNLGIGALPNHEQVSRMLSALCPLIDLHRPDWVLVYGDTNSTLAGSLAGTFRTVPVAHVEAGLRSFNRAMPEETNRVLTDHVSSALFCPTQTAVANLAREGVTSGVYMVGDVMVDVLLRYRNRVGASVLRSHSLEAKQYLLATVHRASNTDDPAALGGILGAFSALGDRAIVLPAHPRLRKAMEAAELSTSRNVILIEPVGYLDMIGLIRGAAVVLTDSGGLQKEAYALGVPCVTLRDETEWVETVEAGWNRLTGPNSERIVEGVRRALTETPVAHPDLYGNGRASERIVEILASL